MARPKKLGTDEMLDIVNKYYEGCGDPARLKCSALEEYAIAQGFNVKAYDFRRDAAVRHRMEELRGLAQFEPDSAAIAYKTLDVDSLLKRCRTRAMLRNSLLELDEQWRRVYERAADISRVNETMKSKLEEEGKERKKTAADVNDLSERAAQADKANNALLLENRYLKKMLRTYLYPAVANEILKQENIIEQTGAEVTRPTVEKLSDPLIPLSFSDSVSTDKNIRSREEMLLSRMRKQVLGGKDNA